MSPDDAEVVRGYVEGRRDCHARVDAWIDEVLRARRLFLGTDREDVAQEVRRRLLVSFRNERFQGEAQLRTYVWRAAQRAALNHLRTRFRKPTEPFEEGFEPEAAAEDPARALDLAERRSLARRILASMGEECRRLFTLSIFDELPYRAIAERLGLSEAAVKVRALRCRRRAAELYREHGGERSPSLPSGVKP